MHAFQIQKRVTSTCSNKNGQMALSVKGAAIKNTGTVSVTFTFAQNVNISIR
jgi:hypothetical protein